MSNEVDVENVIDSATMTSKSAKCRSSDTRTDAYQHLLPSYALGVRNCGRQSIEYVSENVVVYSVAHHLTLFDTETRSMEFLYPTKSVQMIQSFHLSSNREFLAVAEVQYVNNVSGGIESDPPSGQTQISQKQVISLSSHHLQQPQQRVLAIYKTTTRALVRNIPLAQNATVVSCSFSIDNKLLVVLEDAPTHTISYWKVSTGKLIGTSKCPSRCTRIWISPHNSNYISISGPIILKYWLWTNNEFKLGNFLPQTREQEHFVDHLWLKEYMVVISERGSLLTFRSTADGQSVDMVHGTRCHQPSYVRLECLTGHSKGFIIGGSAGFFSLYENSDDPKEPFVFIRTVYVGDVAFECIAVSPGVDTIMACTKSQELLTFSMSTIDTIQEDHVEYKELLQHGNQSGSVVQVDVCLQRPIFASCGIDKTVRIWNYELRQYEVVHHCAEEPMALALHPNGFQLAVTCKERIRLYHILQESLRLVRELPLKSCRAVRYSNGGHMLACAAGLTISIFRTLTCEIVHTFSGHIALVRTLSWTKDDYYLYSGAHDGAVYRWNVATGGRCEDAPHLIKQCQYLTVVSDDNDTKTVYVAGSDGKIRELHAGEEIKCLDLPAGIHVTSMDISRDSRRLFGATNIGSILVFSLPLAASGRSNSCIYEYFAHADNVTSIRVTDDNERLLTTSEDGSVCIFKILTAMDQESMTDDSVKLHERKRGMPAFVDAVLVSREDVEERRLALVEMQQRYDQVKADVEFSLHRKENEWIDRLRLLKEESENLMIQERVRYEELEHRHQLSERKHAEELSRREQSHATMMQELENQYERKLAQEMMRYDTLSESLEQTRQRCEALIEAQDTQHRNTLHNERKSAYSRSKEQNDVIKRLHDDLKYNHVKFEEVLHQEEADYEQELHHLRLDYEKQLENERQNTAVKQGLLSATSTKLETLKKKMQELKASSHARDILLSTERSKAAKLEATLLQYEKHFETCKLTLSTKEKEMGELKASNRVLETFKSVMSHRIDSLEAAKAPMEQHVETLATNIHDMQTELADEYTSKAVMEQEVENKDAKIKRLLHEIKMLRQNMLKKDYSMSEMVREISRMAQMTNWKDVEMALKDAYRVFVMGETVKWKPPKALGASTGTTSLSSPSQASPSKPSPAKHVGKASTIKATKADPNEVSTDLNNQGVTDESLGYDCKQAVNESVKQVQHMSKTIMTLRSSLDNANAKAERIRRDAVAEGSKLIEECNKLRKENKIHLIKIRELEHSLTGTGTNGALSPDLTTSKLHRNRSCPQITPPTLPMTPTHDLIIDTSLSLAIPCGLSPGTPAQKTRSVACPNGESGASSPLPFVRMGIERNRRCDAIAKADELGAVVLQQKKEIQRLKMQVQLLLSNDDQEQVLSPTMSGNDGFPDHSRPVTSTARLGALRSTASPGHTQPLRASFVLTPLESLPQPH